MALARHVASLASRLDHRLVVQCHSRSLYQERTPLDLNALHTQKRAKRLAEKRLKRAIDKIHKPSHGIEPDELRELSAGFIAGMST